MVINNENDILFNDVEILSRLTGKSDLNIISSNNDCDCSSYKPHTIQTERDTDQVPTPTGQAN